MDVQRKEEIKRLFGEAIEQEDGDRDTFLRAACGTDQAVYQSVTSLVDAYASAPDFLATDAWTLEDHLDEALHGRNQAQSVDSSVSKGGGHIDLTETDEQLPGAFD